MQRKRLPYLESTLTVLVVALAAVLTGTPSANVEAGPRRPLAPPILPPIVDGRARLAEPPAQVVKLSAPPRSEANLPPAPGRD